MATITHIKKDEDEDDIAFGFHTSASGDFADHMNKLKTIFPKLSALQIFASNPKSFSPSKWSKAKCTIIKDSSKKNKIRLFIHAPYIINPCVFKPDDLSTSERQVKLVLNLMEVGGCMNAEGVVIHVGKSLKLGEEEGLNRMKGFCQHVLSLKPKTSCKLLIETCSGQGTEVARDLKLFGKLINELVSEFGIDNIACVIDTCHIFAAGYDLAKEPEKVFKTIDKTIDWENVDLVHLNDSATPCGSRVDRHAAIGEGYIKIEALSEYVELVTKCCPHIAWVFETPIGKDTDRMTEMVWFESLL